MPKKSKLLIFFIAIVANASAQLFTNNLPKLYYPQSFFDSAKASNQLEEGKAILTGQAFAIDNMDGAKHYASNSLVILMPYSDYLNEWYRLTKKLKGTNSSAYMHPTVFEIRRETQTDDYGNFTFENLKPGKYFIECIVNYQAKGLASRKTGDIVTSNGYGAVIATSPTYEYYNYRYAVQKRAYKHIEIKDNQYRVETKLKPVPLVPLFDIEKLSTIGVTSPCYRQENLQTGTCTEYFETGKPKIISNWHKNLLDGLYVEYYENGNKKAEGDFKKGLKTGMWSYYNETNGTIKKVENYEYKNGANYLEGEAKFYDENGVLYEKDYYVNGKLEGESITYYKNGKVKDLFIYKDGLMHGKAIYYSTEGNILKEENYNNGKKIN